MDAGLLQPVLDPRRFTLDTVTEAHAHVEAGTGEGKLVIDVAADARGSAP